MVLNSRSRGNHPIFKGNGVIGEEIILIVWTLSLLAIALLLLDLANGILAYVRLHILHRDTKPRQEE